MLPFSYAYIHIVNTMHYCMKMEIDAESCAHLHEEIEVATVIVRADGGVAPHDIFAVYLGGDRDVLANGEAENSILAG